MQEFARKDREMFERVAGKLGVGGKIEYRFGTEFENQEYLVKLLKLARIINFTEAEKAMDQVAKDSVHRMTSSIIYPLMQVLDIGVLGVNVAVGGMAQRKMHVLAIENLKKLGYSRPIALHTKDVALGTALGPDGKVAMMSKSKHNTIDLDETRETLETKIRKTYCSPGDVENNPILSWSRSSPDCRYQNLRLNLEERITEQLRGLKLSGEGTRLAQELKKAVLRGPSKGYCFEQK